MGRIPLKNVPLKEVICRPLCKPKKFELSSSVGYHPHQKIESPCPLITAHIGKKVSLAAFRKKISKILPQACIFSNTIMTYLKSFVGTKSLNTKLSSRIISRNYTPLLPPKYLWETLGM